MDRRVHFYEHGYLRDRQLDTVRHWPPHEVLNLERFAHRRGAQVPKDQALAGSPRPGWMQRLPLMNVKLRPRHLDARAIVYTWGAIVATGPFIVDFDNPFALTGYNLRAMGLYRRLLGRALAGHRCLEIRCLSKACRETTRILFGSRVYDKAAVRYPCLYGSDRVEAANPTLGPTCRFLFVATQFEIKGGAALLRAFHRVHRQVPTARLEVVSHVPADYRDLVAGCPGITVHHAAFTRDEIRERFLRRADVLVHPTYVDSSPMVVLEAVSQGVAVVATRVYGLSEMVRDGRNGVLLEPPVSIWDGYLPSRHYYRLARMPDIIRRTDTAAFEARLAEAMLALAQDPARLLAARIASRELFVAEFSRGE